MSTRVITNIVRSPLALIITVTILLNGTLWAITSQYFTADDPTAILHYSAQLGIDYIGATAWISRIPLIAWLLLVFNISLGVAVGEADRRASWVLWGVMPIIQAILIAALYLLWRVNL
ncbi:hypothetical protein IH781_03155 [Patescibacteria group bacterium]|nr:hypothetical protein [Patescibacteria group bacterium]